MQPAIFIYEKCYSPILFPGRAPKKNVFSIVDTGPAYRFSFHFSTPISLERAQLSFTHKSTVYFVPCLGVVQIAPMKHKLRLKFKL